ncbi:5'-methylthioadenosine/S-adenosylhomocysteine nucleosidase [Chloroflexota bacterium]
MKDEVRPLVEGLGTTAVMENLSRRTFCRGSLAGHDVVVVSCGIGKVRAAACAQLLIGRFGVEKLVFVGTAGALNPGLEVGDIVVSERTMEWDLEAFGVEPRWYQADPVLVETAVRAAERLGRRVNVGPVLSGDRPVMEEGHRGELRRRWGGECVEMEGAALAHVCWMNEASFVLIRAISDQAGEDMAREFVLSYADVAPLPGEVVLEMLRGLSR